MVCRAAARTCSQEAKQRQALNPGSFGGANDVSRPLNVNGLVRLAPNLSIDASAVRDCFASFESMSQTEFVMNPNRHGVQGCQTSHLGGPWTLVNASCQRNDLVPMC
jgi:hypothetical protein